MAYSIAEKGADGRPHIVGGIACISVSVRYKVLHAAFDPMRKRDEGEGACQAFMLTEGVLKL